jgi:hypothetical protein
MFRRNWQINWKFLLKSVVSDGLNHGFQPLQLRSISVAAVCNARVAVTYYLCDFMFGDTGVLQGSDC